MNTTAMAAIAAELAKLTPLEHLLTSELAQKLRDGNKPMASVETQGRKRKPPFDWTEEYTAMANDVAEDNTIQSPKQCTKSLENLAALIGTDLKVVRRKVDTIRRNHMKGKT